MSSPTPSPDRWQRLWDVFHSALGYATAERAGYIDRACADDPGLAEEVRQLVAAHSSEGVLDRPLLARRPDPPALTPGTRLAGRFRVVRAIGSGGMGDVYEAVDEDLATPVAIKTLHPALANSPEALERFRREVLLARRVTHPNACRVFDLCRHDDAAGPIALLTMELVEGETLAERLTRTGPLAHDEAFAIVEQVAAALAAAHRVGIVHRDLKSANVMLTPSPTGGAPRVVVTDFGLAAAITCAGAAMSHLTRSGQLLGTPASRAPEQIEGEAITPATDIYALGLLMYEMMTGALPFAGESPLTLAVRRVRDEPPSPRLRRADLHPSWNATILRCLERKPSDRLPSAAAVVDALRAGSRVPHLFVRRHLRRRAAAAGALAAAVIAIAGTLAWRNSVGGAGVTPLSLEERDWVLVADIENRTGEAVLDDTVRFALERELHASRFVNLVPRERVSDALRLMKRDESTALIGDIAREVALRDGGIRALVRGRVEKLGETYVTAVELVEPRGGVVVASFAERAGGQSEILDGVRALSDRLRAAVGEDLRGLHAANDRLARVTTPSLRALQLFSRADAIIAHSRGDAAAEELLRQAIAEDPDFASAYMHLAHALGNQGRHDEALPYAARAVELAGTASEAERQFIRGGYYALAGNHEAALASYLALLQLHPDHFWGAGNAGMQLSFGLLRGEDAVPHFRQAAALRPNDFMANRNSAWNIAVRGNNLAAARDPVQRARALLTPDLARQHGSAAIWVELIPAYERWLTRDVQGTLEELRRLDATLATHPVRMPLAYHMMRAYEMLGRFREGHELVRPPALSAVGLVFAFLRQDEDTLRRWRALDTLEPRLRRSLGAIGPIVLARIGRADLAKTAMPTGRTDRTVAPIVFDQAFAGALPIVQGEIAWAERRSDDAIQLIQQGLPAERLTGSAVYFLGCESLAAAWLHKGDADRAIAVLEDAFRQRDRTVQGSGAFWMSAAWRLTEIYRQVGRHAAADALEGELRQLLSLADADHPILVAMNRSS